MKTPRLRPRGFRAASIALAALAVALAGRAEANDTKGDIALGEYLAGECVTCHRAAGPVDGIASISGWPEDAFVAVLRDYRGKVRTNQVMQGFASRLTDQDMVALAAYFASLPAPRP